METKIKHLPDSQIEIDFTVPVDEWAAYIKKSQSLAQAAESLMKDKYLEFLSQGKIEPISPASPQAVQMVPGSPAEFKVTVSVLPNLEIKDDYWKPLAEVLRKPVKVEERELEESLEALRKGQAQLSDSSEPAQKGDLITIQFSSPELPSPKPRKDSFLLGQGKLIPGFEDQLVGLKTGEKKEITLTYPANGLIESLRNKPIHFQVEVLKIQKVKWPKLDEHFAQSFGLKTLDDLKEILRKNLLSKKEKEADEHFRYDLLEKIGEKTEIDLPRVLIEAEQNRLLENLKKAVQDELKIPFTQYLKETGKKEEEILYSFLPLAKTNVRHFLLLKAIGQKENLKVSPEEVEKEKEKLLKTLPPERQKTVDQEELKSYIKSSLLTEKAFQKLEDYWKKS